MDAHRLSVALVAMMLTFAWPLQAQAASLVEQANTPGNRTGVAGLLRAQVLLDRAHFSPGEIDGIAGSNQRRAVRGYQQAKGISVTGELDEATWRALDTDAAPTLVAYTLTAEDVGQSFERLPADMMAQSKLRALHFESIQEALGERFHASPSLLVRLNPDVDFGRVGTQILVPNVADSRPLERAARLVIDKSDSTLALIDAAGNLFAQFPVSSGSDRDPLPIGEWKVQGTATNPTFHYNPDLFWDADPAHAKAKLPAGPNNPVGTRWIDLSKPHYGIHGTPEPVAVGKTQSHGCVRLTNWDVERVASAVSPSTPVLMQE